MAVTDQSPGRFGGARAVRAMVGGAADSVARGAQASRELMGPLPLPALLFLAAIFFPAGFNVGPIYMTTFRAFLLVMVVPLTINLVSGKYGRVLWTDILFFLHIAWMSVAVAVNNPHMVVQNTGSAAVEFLGGYLVARACIRSRADFIALCRWLGLIVLVTVPMALVESQTGSAVIITLLEKLPGVRTSGNFYIEPRLGLQRAHVFMPHPIHYGLFCSTAFALTVVALKGVIPNLQRYIVGTAVGAGIFLSLSSGAMLPMFMQIGLILWIALFHRMNRPWLVLSLLTATAYITVDIISNRSALMVFLSYATFSSHNAYWRALIFEWGMKNVWGSPIFGIGFNDWERPFFMYSGSMDNFWLVNAVRYGIPGFLLLAVGYGLGMLRVGMRDFRADPVLAQLRRAWMFTFVGITLTLCTVHVWVSIYSFVFFMFGAGMWFIGADPVGTAAPEREGEGRTAGTAARAGPESVRDRDGPAHARVHTPPERRTAQAPDPVRAARPGTTHPDNAPDRRREGAEAPPRPAVRYTRFPVRPRT